MISGLKGGMSKRSDSVLDGADILFISNFLLIQRYILRGNTTKDIFARISKIAKLGESKI